MSKTTLVLFWVMWLLDVLFALYGYREFIGGVFGRYASPSTRYIALWAGLLLFALLIICGSLYFKNQGNTGTALSIVAIPLVLALPYALYLAAVMIGSKGKWQ